MCKGCEAGQRAQILKAVVAEVQALQTAERSHRRRDVAQAALGKCQGCQAGRAALQQRLHQVRRRHRLAVTQRLERH